MKYLKTFGYNESVLSQTSDLKDIFQSISDFSKINIKYDWIYGKLAFIVSFNLDRLAEPDSIISKYGELYRPVKDGNQIAIELTDAIERSVNLLNLEIGFVELMWINAGEWKLTNGDKSGTGPGLLSKRFKKDGIIAPLEGLVKHSYSTDILYDFIIEKGDRIRNVKILLFES